MVELTRKGLHPVGVQPTWHVLGTPALVNGVPWLRRPGKLLAGRRTHLLVPPPGKPEGKPLGSQSDFFALGTTSWSGTQPR